MISRCRLLLLAAVAATLTLAASDDKTSTTIACTATSTNGGSFFDLRPDIAVPPNTDSKPSRRAQTEDYTVKGYDYGYNFTLNICDAVLNVPESVVGLESALYRNISAYYTTQSGKVYSIGLQNSSLTSRGSQLVLQYSGGSPCSTSASSSKSKRGSARPNAAYRTYEDEDKPMISHYSYSTDTKPRTAGSGSRHTSYVDTTTRVMKFDDTRRKSATLAFRCDRESVTNTPTVSFVGADPEECAYLFVVRSQHACAGVQPSKPGSVGPGGVFAIIMVIAILVYFLGGVFYQRNVTNARGWRQLPNYTFWAGIWNFVSDILVILTSSCARFLPSRRGYRSVSASADGRGMGRSREDEDRLIGQLDEEWDD